MLIFVPDWDLVKSIGFYKTGAKRTFDAVIKWILRNVDRAIQSKKDSLSRKKPGAVIHSEPKIVWLKMIERVGGEYDQALTVRYTFNAALEDQLADRRRHYIIDVGKIMANPNLFSARNALNDDGKDTFWTKVDQQLEDFDYDHDKFKLQKQVQFTEKKKSTSARNHKRKGHN